MMKRNWLTRLLCVLLTLLLALPTAFAGELPAETPAQETPAQEEPAQEAPAVEQPKTEEPATEEPKTEQPAAEEPAQEQPAAEAPIAEQPAEELPVEAKVLDVVVKPATLVQGEAASVKITAQGIEKVLLLVDGKPFPALDVTNMTDAEINAAWLKAALKIQDGEVKTTLPTADLAVGEHKVAVRYFANDAWSQPVQSTTLTINAPAEPEAPTEEDKPAEGEKPAEDATPAEGEKPAEDATIPAEDEKPAEGETPAEGEKPAEGETPVEGEKPAEGETPAEGEKPAEGETPVEGEKPAEDVIPVEGETPAEGETPVDGEVPSDNEIAANVSPTKIIPSETRLEMNVTDIFTLDYSLEPEGADTKVRFTSTAPSVVKVDSETGELTALKAGTAQIKLTTTNGKMAYCSVVVKDPYPVKGITLGTTKSYQLPFDETLQLQPQVIPEDAVTFITWSSSNTRVATVDQDGLVTPNKNYTGKTTIKVMTNNGKYASVTVTVIDPFEPSSVSIDGNSTVYVALDDTATQLSATVLPEKASQDVSWILSSTRYASISLEGVITPKRVGTFYVTARTANRKTDKVKVVVFDPRYPITVTLDPDEKQIDLPLDETLQLNAVVYPDTALDTSLIWTVSSTRTASIDRDTGLLTPKRAGTVTVKVRTTNNHYDTVKVRIYDPRLPMSLKLNYTGSTTVDLYDEGLQIEPTVYPDTAEEFTTFTYKSSSTKVATVSAEGEITLRGPGKTTITVYTKNQFTKSSVKASFTLYVVDHFAPSGITLDQGSSIEMDLYDTASLTYTLKPDDARAKVTYSVSSSSVLSVSEDGEITPKKAGVSTVTVRTHNGKTDTIRVKVTDENAPLSIKFAETSKTVYITDGTAQVTPVLYPETAQAKYTWKTSDKYVATVDQDGLITLIKQGTVRITATTHNGKSATITLFVYDPTQPKKAEVVFAGTEDLTGSAMNWDHVKDGELALELKLTAQDETQEADPGKITWGSSTPSVARINANGQVTWYKNGTARFVGTTEKGKVSASVTVTFYTYIEVKEIRISVSQYAMLVGATQLINKSCLPAGSLSGVKLEWSSSDEDVIAVDQNGKLTAKGAGYAEISCTDSETGVVSNVLNLTSSYPPRYRALVVAHSSEKAVVRSSDKQEYNVTWRRTTDFNGMKTMLGKQNYGGKKFAITSNGNATRAQVLDGIAALAEDSQDSDVTVIAIMAEGTDNGTIWLGEESITPDTLAEALDQINGKVIVFMANDYAGYYITAPSSANEKAAVASNGADAQGKSFNSAFVSAFKRQQKTITVYPLDENGNEILPVAKQNEDGSVTSPNYGELLQDKFFVITAASALEETYFLANVSSWNTAAKTATLNEAATFDYFVRGLCIAGGYDPVTKATKWSNRKVSLQSAYVSTAAYVKQHENTSTNGFKYSHVAVYPVNSSFTLFQH